MPNEAFGIDAATIEEVLLLVAKVYGDELAGALEELAKAIPGAVAAFLRDHPVSDAQWNPPLNPPA